ncbi:hypothetical protein HPB48_012121 [Haemaphysalis longicornis]|uniref:Uncharacterized protein n=1 Tax=Haemaphysalis longicornis TaxID=44386 RepID=A0A9J6GFF8_HAELO|nr:hypothetical protein HPB48_012121 [Haemaphysalis longicornis]
MRWRRHNRVLSSGRCLVSVWGAISRDGLGPLGQIEGSFIGARYCEALMEHLIPHVLGSPFQDGCYLLQTIRSPCTKHAPADLNQIENIGGLLKKTLTSRCICGGTAETLRLAMKEEWEALRWRPEIVAVLYDSMPRRIGQAVAVAGNFSPFALCYGLFVVVLFPRLHKFLVFL